MKAYTDLEQSKKLAEILPLESADMYWWPTSIRYYIEAMDDGDFNEEEGHIRAWSLAALLDVLPKGYSLGRRINGKYYVCMTCVKHDVVEYDNPIDACHEMIIKLHEQKLL